LLGRRNAGGLLYPLESRRRFSFILNCDDLGGLDPAAFFLVFPSVIIIQKGCRRAGGNEGAPPLCTLFGRRPPDGRVFMQKAIARRIRRYFAGGVDVTKLARTILALSVVELGAIAYLLVIRGGELPMSAYVLMGAAFLGVLLSVQGAMALLHACAQVKTVEQTLSELEALNRMLRAQRHDFKNHVQVMSALLEMGETEEAKAYVARLSQDLRNVGLALRTAKPAVNALLQAKANICDSKGIRFEMDIATRLETLPIEQWEFCRILGNLIDNAVEAQEEEQTQSPLIRVSVSDVKGAVVLSVFNSGTKVPESIRHSIFLPDVSTKGKGRGMGLAIVREIAESAGGSVALESDENGTCFTVTLPYENPGDYEHHGFIKVK